MFNHQHLSFASCLLLSLCLASMTYAKNQTTLSDESLAPLALPKSMRGFNTNSRYVDAQLVKRLHQWGANVIRINIHTDKGYVDTTPVSAENALIPYAKGIANIDRTLEQCKKLGMNVILSPSNIVGRKIDVFWKKDSGQNYRDHLAQLWLALDQRYHNHPAIVGYDVLNEPNYKNGQSDSWHKDMLPKAIAAIRSVNKRIWLIVEPGPWGLPNGFSHQPVIDDPYVIYSFHHYAPHNYTHQGVGKHRQHTKAKLVYPGKLQMFDTDPVLDWNQNQLEKQMQAAIDFAQKNKVRMLVGEFGVARWAPGRGQWIADSIAVFEKHGFDWLSHSPCGWTGWNPTFPDGNIKDQMLMGADSDGGVVTEQLQAIRAGLKKNKLATH